MGFQSNGLRDVFEGQGEAGFIAYTYATFDPLEEVLVPGYFSSCRRLAVGDLIFVGTRPRPPASAWMAAQKQTPIRRALLMVASRDEWHRVAVRLVQDYGGPSDGDTPMVGRVPTDGGDAPMVGDASPVQAKRKRGRPPKAAGERA